MARTSKYTQPVSVVTDSRYIAGLYLRLSVEDGDNLENNSIGNQRKICMDFLTRQKDVEFGAVYIDNGRTGMNYRRPGFQAMFADLEDGKINCVIVKDISRLGRNYILTSEYVEKVFPAMGVRLLCVNDEFDSESPTSNQESLLMPFKLIMNDTYVKDTARKIRSSIQAKMGCGEFLPSASSVPYGYLKSPQEGIYIVDGDAAPVVQHIFELRSKGTSFNRIALLLNQEHIPSPGKLRYDRGMTIAEKYRNAIWIRGTIRKITNDSVYLGFRIHGKVKRDRLNGDKKRRPEEEWQVIPNAHPAIIEQELFDKVQEVNRAELEKRSAFDQAAAPTQDFRDIFWNKVFCGDCGAKMTARKYNSRKGGRTPNSVCYNCNQYVYSNQQSCSNHYIRQEILMEKIQHFLDSQIQIAVDVERLWKEAQKKSSPSDLSAALASLSCQRGNLEAKLERLLEDLVSGVLNKEEYTQFRASYLERIALLKAQEMEVRKECEAQQEGHERLKCWLESVQTYKKTSIIDRPLVDELIEKILVFRDRSVKICLTYCDPYKLLPSGAENLKGEKRRAG